MLCALFQHIQVKTVSWFAIHGVAYRHTPRMSNTDFGGVCFVFFLFLLFRQTRPWWGNTVWVCLEHAKALGCSDVSLTWISFYLYANWNSTMHSFLSWPSPWPTYLPMLSDHSDSPDTKHIPDKHKWIQAPWSLLGSALRSTLAPHQRSYTTQFHLCHMLAANQNPSCTLQALGAVPSRLGGWSWHLSEEPPLARGCPLFPLKHSLCILPALQGGTLADLLSRIDIWFNKATQNTHCFNSAPTLQLKLTTGQ